MVAALNEADVDRFVSHYADEVTVQMMASGRSMQGSEAVREWIEDAFDGLDGFSNDVIGIYGEGDTIALEVVANGIANREFAGRAPGQPLDANELYIYELTDGKISGVRVYF
jgi:ketosteroid isomerase-like protein